VAGGFGLVFWKNEAILHGIVGSAFALMKFQAASGMLEIPCFLAAALELHFAEVVHGLIGVAGIWRPRNRDNTWHCPPRAEIGLDC